MSYSVQIGRRADRETPRIPMPDRRRVIEATLRLAERLRAGNVLTGGFRGLRRIRVENWRVLYSVDDDASEVSIIRAALQSRCISPDNATTLRPEPAVLITDGARSRITFPGTAGVSGLVERLDCAVGVFRAVLPEYRQVFPSVSALRSWRAEWTGRSGATLHPLLLERLQRNVASRERVAGAPARRPRPSLWLSLLVQGGVRGARQGGGARCRIGQTRRR